MVRHIALEQFRHALAGATRPIARADRRILSALVCQFAPKHRQPAVKVSGACSHSVDHQLKKNPCRRLVDKGFKTVAS